MLSTNFVSGGNKGDGRNLFVMATATNEEYLNEKNELIAGGTYGERTSDYIKVVPNEQFTVHETFTNTPNIWFTYWICILWYTSEKLFINNELIISKENLDVTKFYDVSRTFTAPSNAAYLRVSARFYDDGRIKLERGSIATDWTPAPEDVVTKTPPDIFDALDSIPEMHRNIFRGKNLGTSFTAEQKAAIKDGSFHDLWLGDYWVINNHTWRIVDINYWYNKGDTNCLMNHIVVMPDAQLYTHNMNATNITDNGYQGSLMYTEGLTQAKTIVNDDFGEDCVLNHRIMLTNASSNGHASRGEWVSSTVELANEIMIYGCHVFAALNDGTTIPYLYTTEYTQLALFRLVPRFINISRQWYWLRDVVSVTSFAHAYSNGHTGCANASSVGGVRPVVGITGGTASADKPDSDLEVTELSTKGGEPL